MRHLGPCRRSIEGQPPKFTGDLADVLADSAIDAVAVAAPAVAHYDVVKRCLAAGKDVFVEKPLALNADQGQELVTLSEKSGRILMVGHILLYHPAVINRPPSIGWAWSERRASR